MRPILRAVWLHLPPSFIAAHQDETNARLCFGTTQSYPAHCPRGRSTPKDISPLLVPVVEKNKVPGMAAAVLRNGEVVALGAAGVRTRGKPEMVTVEDKFHIGSDTKAMTAMLCGILVDEGKLRWDLTLRETAPELNKKIQIHFQEVTLEQLLTHRSGAPGDITKKKVWARLWQHKGSPLQARRLLFEAITSQPPEATPGEKYIYSNAGYAIAGHMAELYGGKPWEDLMREKIFRPLGMTTAGFGAPGTRAKNDQPRGHTDDGSPVEPGPEADNPPAIGPAGTVHCSISDWAKFVAASLPSAKTKLVTPATLEKLHTPAPGEPKYAMGWIIAEGQPWAGGPALMHAGSNTMWYAVAWLAPKKDFAVLIACNQANEKACNDAVIALILDHFQNKRK